MKLTLIPAQYLEQSIQYPELSLCRIVSQEKGLYRIISAEGDQLASVSGKIQHEAASPSDYPVVGDYVMAALNGGAAVINRVLPRKSLFLRKSAGTARMEQAVAANIDTVFICMSLNSDFNLRRLERYLSVAWESGSLPVVVLTKADLCDNPAVKAAQAASIAIGADVLVTSSMALDGYNQILPYISQGKTVAFVGSSGVGKSTLISIISAARPKIANYHFTTLTPVLGVVRVGPEQSFVCADIPGLIEGAAEGVGLGHDFLRHVERCRLLLHVVDVSGCEGRDPKADFEQINHELAGFSAELADRPQIVLGNKCDIATPEQVEEFKNYIEAKGLTFLPISAATRQGVDNLPALVYSRLKDLPPVKVYEAEYKRPDKSAMPTRPFTVTRTGDHEFTVDAPWLERILAGTNVEDYESLQYFQTQLGDSGILDELVAQGVEEEDTIKIGEYEFDYLY